MSTKEKDVKQEEQNKSEEKKKEEIAKTFGIDLKDIEHVFLDNGREYFKFVNPKDKSVRMIENVDYNNGLDTQFKSIQHELAYTQGNNKQSNAQDIYEHNLEYKNTELDLITIRELKNNRFKYNREINQLNAVNKKKLKVLLKNCKQLRLRYINIENAIGINENNEVIDVKYDYLNNKAQICSAEVISYTNTNDYTEEVNHTMDIPEETFDEVISGIDIIDGEAVVVDNKDITINGETISANDLVTCYNMPEVIDKVDLSDSKKTMLNGLIRALHRKKEFTKQNIKNQKQKVLVKKDNKKNAA